MLTIVTEMKGSLDLCHYRGRIKNFQNACKCRHLSDLEIKYLKIILDDSGSQPTGFWRFVVVFFLQLLILACKVEVHQEECWK